MDACADRAPPADRDRPPPFPASLPLGFPAPPVPADNPLTPAKIELGRRLFYDPRLSGPGTQACASCHRQELAFTDGRARAVGSTGEIHPRSAMSLTNVAYSPRLGWADPDLDSLEAQARVPLLNQSPVEMGMAGRETEVLARFARSAPYRTLFARAFPDDIDGPIRLDHVTRALASFERTLISGDSAYDRLLFRDDQSALSDPARAGMQLFFSQRLRCASCHAGLHLAGALADSPRLRRPVRSLLADLFQNTALYDIDGLGSYPAPNQGLARATGRDEDMGRFRIPTLRNVAVTAPYMHDGSVRSLEDALLHYAAGGRASSNPRKSPELTGFSLSARERADLIAFLESLTDPLFLSRPSLSDPFAASEAPAPH